MNVLTTWANIKCCLELIPATTLLGFRILPSTHLFSVVRGLWLDDHFFFGFLDYTNYIQFSFIC